jgi:outer membrane lipoprotein carrier protein
MKLAVSKKTVYGMCMWVFMGLVCANRVTTAEPALSLQELLDKVQQRYQSIQAYTAYFKQTTTSAAGSLTTEATGKLHYQKPRQMRWDYETPEPQTFVANKELAWLHVPAEKQISLYDAKNLITSPLSRTFFDGVFELKKDFRVELDPKQSNQISALLVLTPKVEDPSIQSLRLQIDLRSFQLMSLETRDVLGNTNRILLESQREKPELDAALFRLVVPPDTKVLDADGRELTAAEIQKLKNQIQWRSIER